MIKLYQLENCPYCKVVREKLQELQISYISIPVPKTKEERQEVLKVSGQYSVPTMIDGETVIADDDKAICDYLDGKYKK